MKRTVMTVLFLVGISTYAQEVQKDTVATTPKVEKRTVIKVVSAPTQTVETSKDDFTKVRIALNGGYGYRTAKIPEGETVVQEYFKSLKSGFDWNIDAHYFVNEELGLGLKYSSFSSSNVSNKIMVRFPDGTSLFGVEDNVSITYIAPSFMARLFSPNEKNAFILGASIGYISYKDEGKVGYRNITISGGTVGFGLDAGYDFGLSENISLGIMASLTSGMVNQVEVKEGNFTRKRNLKEEKGEGEGLGRFTIGAGFRFHI